MADDTSVGASGLHHFPAEVTSFVGRRDDVRAIRRHLSDSRLVTLTGTGGVGKTRLACRVAAELRRVYPDGLWFVDLSEIRQPELVPGAVADALDVGAGPVASALYTSLGRRHALVVLDNCEHVLDVCSSVAHKMLCAAPKLRVLATSREPLSVLGETIVDVAPLSLAPTEGPRGGIPEARESEAVDLFCARASAVQPDFTMDDGAREDVAELCRLLDGIPLAIELAAFQVRALPLRQILARQGSVFDMLTRGNRAAPRRHQTLLGALEWSYELCTSGERALWERLSVFTGSFDLEAVEKVCSAAAAETDVLEHFTRLIEKSVVVPLPAGTDTRYRLLDSIKHFGAAKLSVHDDAQVWHRRHRDHYLRVAVLSEQNSTGPDQAEWNSRLQDDVSNIRTALDFCFAHPDEHAAGLRMASSLWFFWNASGHLRDGRHWLGRALDLVHDASSARMTALWAMGWYAMVQGEPVVADGCLRECLELAARTGDDHARARALQFQGTAEQVRGDLDSALGLLVTAMAHHQRSEHEDVLTILCGTQLGFLYCVLDRGSDAGEQVDAAVALGRRRGERFATSWALWVRGLLAWSRAEFDAATSSLREAIELKLSLRDWLGTAACVEILAWLAVEAGDHRRAAVLIGVGRRLCGELASSPLFGDVALTETRQHYEAAAATALGAAPYDKHLAAGESLDHERAVAYVLADSPADTTSEPHPPAAADGLLSRREVEVVRHVVDGMTNKEIAETLVISRRTVEGHVERALVKTGLRSRSQLAGWFVGHHIGDAERASAQDGRAAPRRTGGQRTRATR